MLTSLDGKIAGDYLEEERTEYFIDEHEVYTFPGCSFAFKKVACYTIKIARPISLITCYLSKYLRPMKNIQIKLCYYEEELI
jgi:hypothetical protein